MAERKKFVVLDGNSLAHRAFYAIPLLSTSKGIFTNAVYGFTNMLQKLIAEQKPDYLVVAFDKGKINFRHACFGDYKRTRKGTPEELRPQFAQIKRVLEAMNIPFIEVEGFEADDLIGTLVRRAETEGLESVIVTGDRDALQLVSPHVRVMLTRKGISDLEIYGEAEVWARYGLTPAQVVDLKALMGDASDNIPGVPGIGEKTALKLLTEFKTVEELLTHLDRVTPAKLQAKLQEFAEQARLSKRLATICCDVPIDVEWSECAYTEPNLEQLLEVFKDLEFKSLINNVVEQMAKSGPKPETARDRLNSPELTGTHYLHLNTLAEVNQFLNRLRQAGEMAVYVESTHPHPMYGQIRRIALSAGEGQTAVLAFDKFAEQKQELLARLNEVFATEEIYKIFHDAKAALIRLRREGIALKGMAGDTMLAAYLLNPGLAKQGLEELVLDYLNEVIVPSDDAVWAAGRRAEVILKLHCVLQHKLTELEMEPLYRQVELPLIPILADMEMAGIRLDVEQLEVMSAELGRRIEEITQEIYTLAGEEFNINSTRQLGIILYEKLKLPVLKKTKTGYSTNAEVLEELANQHEVVAKILEHRQLVKLKSTYVDGLRQLIHPETGKIHTTFNQTVTATGRLSSTEPNLQNIPIRLEHGRKIRKVFVPSETDNLILTADYSQIELRVLAHVSGDRNLRQAFLDERDIHTHTAAEVFHVPLNEVNKEMRRRAKAVNFGIVYGISEFGLSRDLGISRQEAREYIANYLDTYPQVRKFMADVVQEGRNLGYVTTLLKRRRYLPELFSSNRMVRNFGERAAINTPIQGSAADIIKLAMLRVAQALRKHQLGTKMLLQVHDELIFEVPRDEIKVVVPLVKTCMENAVTLSVPLVVDIHVGPNWYDLAKVG
ncbi:MAG: DNA polymerase I [Firmicutes bacterium]|nr:DNA polymerase I [Bacillota bacterium]